MAAGAWVAGGLVAAVVSAAGSGLIAWAGPIDRPGARTSHARPTPTSGGLAILAGASLGLLTFAALSGGGARRAAVALGFASALGLFGALDDLFDFGAKLKLGLGGALALIFAALVAPVEALPLGPGLLLPLGPVIGAAGAALWIFTVANGVNFMDGANGVAPGGMAIAFLALAAAAQRSEPAIAACALAAALAGLGFLPWNMAKRLFQGDVGSLFSGFLFAALCLEAAGRDARGPVDLYFGPTALLPFLTDVLLTLLRRARGGRPLLSAHREHLYQRWLAAGRTHGALAWRWWGVCAGFGGIALWSTALPAGLHPSLFAAAVVLASALWVGVGRTLPRSS